LSKENDECGMMNDECGLKWLLPEFQLIHHSGLISFPIHRYRYGVKRKIMNAAWQMMNMAGPASVAPDAKAAKFRIHHSSFIIVVTSGRPRIRRPAAAKPAE
jgi:hypothetical protein